MHLKIANSALLGELYSVHPSQVQLSENPHMRKPWKIPWTCWVIYYKRKDTGYKEIKEQGEPWILWWNLEPPPMSLSED
jgi:hypothetical protein